MQAGRVQWSMIRILKASILGIYTSVPKQQQSREQRSLKSNTAAISEPKPRILNAKPSCYTSQLAPQKRPTATVATPFYLDYCCYCYEYYEYIRYHYSIHSCCCCYYSVPDYGALCYQFWGKIQPVTPN